MKAVAQTAFFFGFLVFAVYPIPSLAGELRALKSILSHEYEASYPFVRCAAVYDSTLSWASANGIDEESAQRTIDSVQLLSLASERPSSNSAVFSDRRLVCSADKIRRNNQQEVADDVRLASV